MARSDELSYKLKIEDCPTQTRTVQKDVKTTNSVNHTYVQCLVEYTLAVVSIL